MVAELTLGAFLVAILVHLTAMHVHHAVASGTKALANYLKKDAKLVNHDLKRALKRSFLSALQNIVLECHYELYPHKSLLPYPSDKRDTLKWLDRKRNQLATELKELEQQEPVEAPFAFFGEVESLFNPTNQLSKENVQSLREKLITEALKNDANIPECYDKQLRAHLFEQVTEYFAWEIKYNPVVYNILSAQFLAQINAHLTEQKLVMQNLVKLTQSSQPMLLSNNDQATAKITLDVALEALSTPKVLDMVENLQKQGKDVTLRIRRIEEGSVVLVLEGSQKGIKQLETLFQSRQLTEIEGIPVKDVQVMSALTNSTTLVKLSQWLAGIFEEGWQTVEAVLGTQGAVPAFGFARGTKGVRRAKVFDFNGQAVALVIMITETVSDQAEIRVQLRAVDEAKVLPQGLKLRVEIDSDSEENHVSDDANLIELELSAFPGELFMVQVALENAVVTEHFVI